MKVESLDTKKVLDYYVGGFLILFLRPLTRLVGLLTFRDHTSRLGKSVLFIKMLGGGSLVLAYPAILSLKKKYPKTKFMLLTTPSVKPFGELLNVFDTIICVSDKSIVHFLFSSLAAWVRCFRVDTVIDYEVYSRLSTIFSLFTWARNRVGFYLENIFWRQHINTHLIYFNRFSASGLFYDQTATLFDAPIIDIRQGQAAFHKAIPRAAFRKADGINIAIGHACSSNGKERQLTAEQWLLFFKNKIDPGEKRAIHFFGSKADFDFAEEIARTLATVYSTFSFHNHCGTMALKESADALREMDEFWGVDSALLHIARLLGTTSKSIWGPTDPKTRLRLIPDLKEEIVYDRIFCSPCIHVTENPPCRGNNMCIKLLFDEKERGEMEKGLFTAWPGSGQSR